MQSYNSFFIPPNFSPKNFITNFQGRFLSDNPLRPRNKRKEPRGNEAADECDTPHDEDGRQCGVMRRKPLLHESEDEDMNQIDAVAQLRHSLHRLI